MANKKKYIYIYIQIYIKYRKMALQSTQLNLIYQRTLFTSLNSPLAYEKFHQQV